MSAETPRMTDLLGRNRVIPILTIADAGAAPDLARALCAGGLDVLEVVVRTPVSLTAIERIRAEVPEAVVGAGTLLGRGDVERAVAAGARFGVSPGLTDELGRAANDHRLPMLPGVSSAGEIMRALDLGFDAMKFFPAFGPAGVPWLKMMAPVFPKVVFCATGGIRIEDVAGYFALPNCPAIGCSWVAPSPLVAARDWAAITDLARRAAAIGRVGDA